MSRTRLDQAALDRLLNSPDGPVGKDLARRTVQVETAAKRLCPVDTGRLRSSITHSIEADSRGLAGIVGTDVDYAEPVELTQPFLRPALDAAGGRRG
jgi:hypothetical protein